MPSKIVYVSFPVTRPVGGVSVLAEHVTMLREAGQDAVLWLPGSGDGSGADGSAGVGSAGVGSAGAGTARFQPSSAPTIRADTLELTAEDLLVVPEVAVLPGRDPAPGARKVIFSQNHFLSFHAWSDRPDVAYPGWTPEPDVWVVSQESAEVLGRLSTVRPHFIPNFVDAELFRPGVRQRPTVAWMPRKRHLEAELIRRLLLADPRSAGVRLIELDNLAREQVAAVLAQTTVFVALGLSESFGLPVAEALSAGCFVVGYDGGGGHELFEAPGVLRIPDQRPALVVDAVFGALSDEVARSDAERNRSWLHRRYHRDRTFEALTAAIDQAGQTESRSATATHPWPWLDSVAPGGIPASG